MASPSERMDSAVFMSVGIIVVAGKAIHSAKMGFWSAGALKRLVRHDGIDSVFHEGRLLFLAGIVWISSIDLY
jgi:hypothetical protein